MPEISDDDLGTLIWCAMGHDRCLPQGQIPRGVLAAMTPEWRDKAAEWVSAAHRITQEQAERGAWFVTTNQAQGVAVKDQRSAEKLAVKLTHLGIPVGIYEATPDGWENRGWRGANGGPYRLPDNFLHGGDVTTPRRVSIRRADGSETPCDVFRDPDCCEGRTQWLAVPQDSAPIRHEDWLFAEYWPPGSVITMICGEGHSHAVAPGLDLKAQRGEARHPLHGSRSVELNLDADSEDGDRMTAHLLGAVAAAVDENRPEPTFLTINGQPVAIIAPVTGEHG